MARRVGRVGGAHIKLVKCIVLRRVVCILTSIYHYTHTHYMYKTRITMGGRWVGRVGGAHSKLIKCIVHESSMYTKNHLSLHTHYM